MKHYIIVKWNSSVTDKDSIVNDVKNIFDKLVLIDGIHKVEFIQNVVDRSNRYDLMIRIDMDKNALEKYDASTPHNEWKNKYAKYVEFKAIFDSED